MIRVTHHAECFAPLTNVSFMMCKFTKNIGELINFEASVCRANFFITGPSHFANTKVYHYLMGSSIITISYVNVCIIGPVVMSSNYAFTILRFKSCDVLFHKHILLKSNNCDQLVSLRFTYIKIMEYTNVTIVKNKHLFKLLDNEYNDEYRLYPLCIFQFMSLRNATAVSPSHYSINIIDDLQITNLNWISADIEHHKKCAFPYYHFTPHCQWIPTAAFHNFNPKAIYQQIIQFCGANLTNHKICHCPQNGSIDCSVDMFGPVYPGQKLQLELCTPCI